MNQVQNRIVVLLACVLTAGLASCRFTPNIQPSQAWDNMAREHDQSWDRLRKIQRGLEWDNFGDRITEVPGVGRIIVRDWRLLGTPGREYLRLFFTYENATKQDIKETRVWVNVRDKEGRLRGSSWLDLYLPWYEFAPGNTWTGEIRVATGGAHYEKGWRWEVGARADYGKLPPQTGSSVVTR